MSKYCIFGTGGSGRETLVCLRDTLDISMSELRTKVVFMVDDDYYEEQKVMDIPVIRTSVFDPEKYKVIVSVGVPSLRKEIVARLGNKTQYHTLIHPKAMILGDVSIGVGSIIAAGSVLTTNISIGQHSQINVNVSVTHDCRLGDFVTLAPGVNISGNCIIGDSVYMGCNSATREKISIGNNVTIGMGAVVVSNIRDANVYVGNPARAISSSKS